MQRNSNSIRRSTIHPTAISGCATLLLLAACGKPAAPPADMPAIAAAANPPKASVAASPGEDWAGKWVGVEGLALEIAPRAAMPGRHDIRITLMDGTTTHEGTGTADGISFMRDGQAETIRAGTGADTGLKWLADKTDCLIIKPGEAFCRG